MSHRQTLTCSSRARDIISFLEELYLLKPRSHQSFMISHCGLEMKQSPCLKLRSFTKITFIHSFIYFYFYLLFVTCGQKPQVYVKFEILWGKLPDFRTKKWEIIEIFTVSQLIDKDDNFCAKVYFFCGKSNIIAS